MNGSILPSSVSENRRKGAAERKAACSEDTCCTEEVKTKDLSSVGSGSKRKATNPLFPSGVDEEDIPCSEDEEEVVTLECPHCGLEFGVALEN